MCLGAATLEIPTGIAHKLWNVTSAVLTAPFDRLNYFICSVELEMHYNYSIRQKQGHRFVFHCIPLEEVDRKLLNAQSGKLLQHIKSCKPFLLEKKDQKGLKRTKKGPGTKKAPKKHLEKTQKGPRKT